MQSLSGAPLAIASMVWKCWAPSKFKFFAWLLLQNMIWTIYKKNGPTTTYVSSSGGTSERHITSSMSVQQPWKSRTQWQHGPTSSNKNRRIWFDTPSLEEWWSQNVKATTKEKKSRHQVNSHPSILGNMEEEEQPRIQEWKATATTDHR